MQVIGIASQKGGAGKSTLAVNLALLADRKGVPALMIDTDPQASLAFWRSLRDLRSPVLVSCRPHELGEVLDAAERDGVEWAFIDGPPSDRAGTAALMEQSDLVVIPTRAAAFDLAAIASTIDMARALGRPFMVVLNAVPPRRGVADLPVVAQARRTIEALGAPVWRGTIAQRAPYTHAIAAGRAVTEFDPDGAAAQEIRQLWRDLKRTAETIAELRLARQQQAA